MGPLIRSAGVAPLALLLLGACAADRVTGVSAPTAAPAAAVRLPLRTCGAAGGRDALLVLDGRVLGRAAEVARNGAPIADPAEITSIEIIKGPAALARFGHAAAEGVIMIQTRKSEPDAQPMNPQPREGEART